ncbi:MAG: hypothetical protein MN733_39590 [Nitrososphaera sp.]|nr:hypothetical protein [Nitrososphaera sp.]
MIHSMIFFGEDSLRHAIREYMLHYHRERNHQGINNRRIKPSTLVTLPRGRVHRRKRLGGILSYYHREAA